MSKVGLVLRVLVGIVVFFSLGQSHALTCAEAVSTVHAQYLVNDEKMKSDLLGLLLSDESLSEAATRNPYLSAYLVARYELDPSIPDEVRSSIVSSFTQSNEALISQSELAAIDAVVQAKLKESGLRDRAGVVVAASRDQHAQARDRKASRERYQNLIRTIRSFNKILDEEFTFSKLDSNLYGFHGFHMDRDATGGIPRTYVQRPWNKVSPSGISTRDIVNINQEEYAAVALFAKEIEDPIVYYSGDSGSMLQAILPKLGRFMGKTDEQMKFAYEQNPNNPKWCESPWCEEEKRHGPFLGKIYERITGKSSDTGNPHEGSVEMKTLENAIEHLYSRQANEWAASSAYVYLAGHAKEESDLQKYLMNIARDEIKHLAIVCGAFHFLFGPQLNKRVGGMLKVTFKLLGVHQENRTSASSIFGHPLSRLEVFVVYTMMELRIRKWLQHLPHKTVKLFFDGTSLAPTLQAVEASPEDRKRIDAQMTEGKRIREKLELWTRSDRDKVFEQERFENENQALIRSVIDNEFNGFHNLESAESQASVEALKRIQSYRVRGVNQKLFRKVLQDELRHYQIMNNPVTKSIKLN